MHTSTSPDPSRLRSLGDAASRVALQALLRAHDLLGHATGHHLREARAQDDPLRVLQARVEEAELKARLAWDVVELLRAVPERTPRGSWASFWSRLVTDGVSGPAAIVTT